MLDANENESNRHLGKVGIRNGRSNRHQPDLERIVRDIQIYALGREVCLRREDILQSIALMTNKARADASQQESSQ